MRVRKLFEDKKIGDRTPSQFYRDLRKLATPMISDEFVLTLWKNRLLANAQLILAASTDSDPKALTAMADRIHETRSGTSRIAAVSEPLERAQNAGTSEPWVACYNSLNEQMIQLRVQINALSFGNARPS